LVIRVHFLLSRGDGRAVWERWMQFVKPLRLPAAGRRVCVALCLGLSLLTMVGCGAAPTAPPTNTATKDFGIVVSPATVTAVAGSSNSTFTVSTTGQNGFSDSVTVAISGLPAGATTSPAFPFSVSVSKSQTVTLSVPASNGDFPLTITGSSGSLTHSASLKLMINAAQDFRLDVSPSTIAAAPGSSSSSFTVSASGQNGFNGSVGVAVSGLPAGASTLPASPFSVPAGSSQNVSLSIPTTLSPGSYSLMVSGTSGSLAHSAALALTVTSSPDFNINVSPATITTNPGGSGSFTVSTSGLNGFNGLVGIAISGLPVGASTLPPSPFNVVAGNSQTVSWSIPSTASPGSYSVMVSGSSGSLAHSVTLALTVNPPPDFSIALSPSAVAANVGTSTSSFTASITGLNGFTNSIDVTISGLPNGTTCSPASFGVAAGGNQTVTITVPTAASNGEYTVTATGTSGSLTHSALLALTIVGQASITTWHYDNARTGANINETTLTPANVNSTNFGKLATFPVDGFVVGHPLYLLGVNILGQGVHNVVYVATMHDSVYAFDADSTNTSPLWMTSILNAGATPVPTTVKRGSATTGWSEVGIVSTPVIDPASGTIYLVAETYESGNVVHRLHALDVTSGSEIAGSPVTIAATYTLNGTTTTFKDLYQLNRPGLLLANGHIYIGFGSNCCNDYSQGWVLSYNAATLQQEGTFTTEPDKTLASIWQKGAGLSTDSSGNVYGETGEGFYAAGANLSTSVFKLSQNGTTLGLTDWFTPYNHPTLSLDDLDLANGVVILPDQMGSFPHEAVTIGKVGPIYVLNRDSMGQLCTTCTIGDTQIVQEVPVPHAGYNTPVYWNNTIYFAGTSTPVTAYTISNGTLVLPPAAQSATMVETSHPMITANGNTNGILWVIESGGWLMAMDAITLNTLYSSTQAPGGRDTLPPLAHFAIPIAADGKVFVGTQNSVVVYGLLSGSAALTRQGSSRADLQLPLLHGTKTNFPRVDHTR
jgi:hypothetical protein